MCSAQLATEPVHDYMLFSVLLFSPTVMVRVCLRVRVLCAVCAQAAWQEAEEGAPVGGTTALSRTLSLGRRCFGAVVPGRFVVAPATAEACRPRWCVASATGGGGERDFGRRRANPSRSRSLAGASAGGRKARLDTAPATSSSKRATGSVKRGGKLLHQVAVRFEEQLDEALRRNAQQKEEFHRRVFERFERKQQGHASVAAARSNRSSNTRQTQRLVVPAVSTLSEAPRREVATTVVAAPAPPPPAAAAAAAPDQVPGVPYDKMSRARVYTDVNSKRPEEYWDYESLTVQWGCVLRLACVFVRCCHVL